MINNLEKALLLLFRRVPVQEVIQGTFDSGNIREKDFIQLMKRYYNQYSDTENENLFDYFRGSFIEQFQAMEEVQDEEERLDIFALLRYYSDKVLTVQDGEVVCEYSQFLRWREVTKGLSEDLLITCFLAHRELKKDGMRTKFDWKVTITHNNRELRKILEQGMAENHFHLKGSAPVFQLTWINLMNNLQLQHSRDLRKIEERRQNVNMNYKSSYEEEYLSMQLLRAACIRLILFGAINEGKLSDIQEYQKALYSAEILLWKRQEITDEIETLKNSLFAKALPDYALLGVLETNHSLGSDISAFQGERWLLYAVFKEILGKNPRIMPYRNLFYAYLVIKENFRAEIVQNNKTVGFENFSTYEMRKDVFLENPFFQQALIKEAIKSSLFESKVLVLEARITPKETAEKNKQYIQKLDNLLVENEKYRHRTFYTVHFIKSRDRASGRFVQYRHYKQRRMYRKQALALAEFRQRYPNESNRVRGIDAANMEIGCGPEVFAQVFRYLTNHIPGFESTKHPVVSQLRITYHVGEDFLDLVSGLRAIDEAMLFLNMRCGDRLGHAIALGVNVREWYASKDNRILLSQQEYLDNIAWLYYLLIIFDISDVESIKSYLLKEYNYHFQIIYKNAMTQEYLELINKKAKKYYEGTEWYKYYNNGTYNFSIENYYNAWKLRGDNPELYEEGFFKNEKIIRRRLRDFTYYAVNRKFPKRQNERYFQEIGMLYYYYHFNSHVRREGAKTIEKKVTPQLIVCVEKIQHELQKKVAEYGISVETNPSSNCLIGTFEEYAKHPIISLYNSGLVEDEEQLKYCPQIDVSINTDDAGIFGTSLENEYAYMALALEKAKDENGNALYKKKNIYTWLDNIRQMGLRQTFLNDEEMKRAVYEWSKTTK